MVRGLKIIKQGWKKMKTWNIVNFANLLEMVAKVSPDLRVRFSTSHPKDITDEVLLHNEEVRKYLQEHPFPSSKW